MYRDILRNITWLGAASLLVKPFWLLFLVAACPRLLGLEGYGVMMAAMALTALTCSFADLGMGQFTLREVARNRSLAGRFLTNFVLLRGGLLVLGWLLAFGAAFVLHYRGPALLAVVFAGLYWTTQNMTLYARVFFRAHETLRYEAISTVVEKVVVLAFAVPLLVLTEAPHWTLAGMAAGMALTMGVNLGWIARHLAPLRSRLVSAAFLKGSLRMMIPLGIAGMLTVFYMRTDLVMVEAMLGEAAAGEYGQAFRILEALAILPFIVAQSALFPRLSALFHQEAFADFHRLLWRGMVGLLVVSVGIAAVLTALAPWLIQLLVGDPRFAGAAPALQVLAWTFPFACANSLLYVAFISMDQHRFPIAILSMATVINIGCNFVAIPTYGIIGAALMTVLSEVFIVAAYTYRYRTTAAPILQKNLELGAAEDL